MRRRAVLARLTPSRPQAAVLLTFGVAFLTIAWPTLRGRTSSVVPSFQTATYPWAAQPRGLAFTWPQSDQAESTFPWAVMARRSWRSGDLPLWDPHSFGGGVPWSSDGVSATLYPVRAFVDAWLMPWLAHDVFVLVHLALAGAGAYWLSRLWGAGRLGATVGGIGWMTSAYVWSWAPLEMVTPFFAFLPLSLAAVHGALTSPSRRWVSLAGFVLGIGMTAGNIVYSLLVVATCALYAVALLVASAVRARGVRDRALGRQALAAASVLALALATSAAAVLPTVLTLSRVSRQPFTFDVLRESLLVPWDTYTRLWSTPESPPTAEQLVVQIYLTPVVLALAVVGLLLARGRGAWSARGLLVVPVLIASTVPGAWVAYHFLPGFDAVKPYARMLPMALLAAHVLAALGADRLWTWLAPHLRGRLLPVGGAIVGALLVGGVFVPAQAVSSTLAPPDRAVADYPLFPSTPLLRQVNKLSGGADWPIRVMPGTAAYATDPPTSSAPTLVGGTASAPGIDTWGGYASAIPEETSDVIRLISGEDPEVVLGSSVAPDLAHPIYSTSQVDWLLACRLGTDVVVLPPAPPEGVLEAWGNLPTGPIILDAVYSGPDGRILQLPPGCDSGPYLTPRAEVVASDSEAFAALRAQGDEAFARPDRAVARAVVLDGEAATSDGTTLDPSARGTVEESAREGRNLSFDVSSDGDMWLVVPVSYDVGWSAEIDGKEVDLSRVDFNRMGVQIPEGDHDVELSYWPPGQTPGLVLTLLGLLATAALLVPMRRSTRRTDDVTESAA